MVILVNCPLAPEDRKRISALSSTVQLVDVPMEEGSLPKEALKVAEVIYTTEADFDPVDAPRLRWVQLNTAAVNHIASRPIAGSEVPIANVSGAYSVAVAEFAIGILLALTRHIAMCVDFQREKRWPDDERPFQGEDLFAKTMGIVGYGSVGRQIARLGQALGMTVLACKRHPQIRRDTAFRVGETGDPEGVIPRAWYGTGQVREMFGKTDVAMIAIPQTQDTIGLIGKSELEALPVHAYLVNIGRGAVTDEAALADCLRDGRIAGAALDVFAQEPLDVASPLWRLPNVLITPHIASWTTLQAHRAAEVLIENLTRDLRGEPLINLIDKKLMY